MANDNRQQQPKETTRFSLHLKPSGKLAAIINAECFMVGGRNAQDIELFIGTTDIPRLAPLSQTDSVPAILRIGSNGLSGIVVVDFNKVPKNQEYTTVTAWARDGTKAEIALPAEVRNYFLAASNKIEVVKPPEVNTNRRLKITTSVPPSVDGVIRCQQQVWVSITTLSQNPEVREKGTVLLSWDMPIKLSVDGKPQSLSGNRHKVSTGKTGMRQIHVILTNFACNLSIYHVESGETQSLKLR